MATTTDEVDPSLDINVASSQNSNTNETNLVDEKGVNNQAFEGATLELNSGQNADGDPEVRFVGQGVGVGTGNFRRDRPGSTMSRKSGISTGSRTSISASIVENKQTSKLYFSKRVRL